MHIETFIVEKGTDTLALATLKHAKGMSEIGNGLYSFVYGSEGTPYVVKIFRGHDKGYRGWVHALTQIGDLGSLSRYVPQIHKAFLYRHADETYTGITPGYGFKDTMVVYLEPLEGINSPWHNPMEEDYRKRRRTPLARFADKLTKYVDSARDEPSFYWGQLRPVHQDLVALILLAQSAAGGKPEIDIHYANVMRRGNQIRCYGSTFRRLKWQHFSVIVMFLSAAKRTRSKLSNSSSRKRAMLGHWSAISKPMSTLSISWLSSMSKVERFAPLSA
jgi:hypothetical protein